MSRSRSELIEVLARAAADYYLIVKLLLDHHEEARSDPEVCHERAVMITVHRAKAKGRKITKKQLNLALKTIREHATH